MRCFSSSIFNRFIVGHSCDLDITNTGRPVVCETKKVPNGPGKLCQALWNDRLWSLCGTDNSLEHKCDVGQLKSRKLWRLFCLTCSLIFLARWEKFCWHRWLISFEFSKILKLVIVIVLVPFFCNCYMFFLYDQALKKKKPIPEEKLEDDITENFFVNESESQFQDN